jgi:purine-binding chemotaxis protein CheW
VWAPRSARLPATDVADPAVDVVLVPVDEDLYAVPIAWVREVVPAPALTRLVTAPSMVLGLFNLRGEIVPLLDVAALLGTGRTGSVAFVVVLDTHLGLVALSATDFPLRTTLDGDSTSSETTGAACFRVGRRLAVLVDVQMVLDAATASGGEQSAGSGRFRGTLVRPG